ncbi:MAG: molybdopterin-guanine dinucleotide biosynthesis protein B [Thermodesulforhabdaceae bacterium]|jgi:molybdopterin-guanine dinucleotide biosynthesis protein B
MVPVICIVGYHKSGKTTFMEGLIGELSRRGYRVGTIKHDVHGFDIDQEGKDTWRHRKAGSLVVALSSASRLTLIKELQAETPVDELVTRFFGDVDIVLAEGFKQLHYPKIEVFRREVGEVPLANSVNNLIAMVSDDQLAVDVPVFSFRDVAGVANLIEQRYLAGRKTSSVTVLFDGKKVPMNDFVTKIVENTIIGLCSTLRGWEEPSEITINIRRRR